MPSNSPARIGYFASSDAQAYRMVMVTATTWAVYQTCPSTALV
jgi:hypothetical protein